MIRYGTLASAVVLGMLGCGEDRMTSAGDGGIAEMDAGSGGAMCGRPPESLEAVWGEVRVLGAIAIVATCSDPSPADAAVSESPAFADVHEAWIRVGGTCTVVDSLGHADLSEIILNALTGDGFWATPEGEPHPDAEAYGGAPELCFVATSHAFPPSGTSQLLLLFMETPGVFHLHFRAPVTGGVASGADTLGGDVSVNAFRASE